MNRTWQKDGKRLYFEVNEAGVVEVRYDVFEKLLADAGWHWIPDDQHHTTTERTNTQ